MLPVGVEVAGCDKTDLRAEERKFDSQSIWVNTVVL